MKNYPSIPFRGDLSLRYHVFDKLDGSNLRVEWSRKRGFHKFGSRTQLLTPDQAALWPALAAIQELDRLPAALDALKTERVVCFFEWFGPHSFAGRHRDKPDQMRLALLDVAVYKKGLLAPDQVLALADRALTPMPGLLHAGRVDADFLAQVEVGTLPGMTFEGIVAKGPFMQSAGGPVMFKHKSRAWLARLRAECGPDQARFQSLA